MAKNRLSDETKLKIKELRKKGYKIKEVAELLGVSTCAVYYHQDDESKESQKRSKKKYVGSLSKEKRREMNRKNYPKVIECLNRRYKEDEDFREMKKQLSKEYYYNVFKKLPAKRKEELAEKRRKYFREWKKKRKEKENNETFIKVSKLN